MQTQQSLSTNDPVPEEKIRLGISSCLMGETVRFDGNHKKDSYITGTLAAHFEFVPVCPEVAIGLGVPRPPIQLVGNTESPRAVGVKDPDLDVTDRLRAYGREMAAELAGISGYILKNRSPSCGMERVKIYGARGAPRKQGTGIYAAEILSSLPWLPVEEEGRLGNAELRDNFLERVFSCRRWQELCGRKPRAGALVDFHSRHKLCLMAHSPAAYQELGRMVADSGKQDLDELGSRYLQTFMDTLKKRATRKQHANVLHHLMGYLKNHLEKADKRELLDLIDGYRLGNLPRIVPLTLLRHHFRRHPDPYIESQFYIYPQPLELRLRPDL